MTIEKHAFGCIFRRGTSAKPSLLQLKVHKSTSGTRNSEEQGFWVGLVGQCGQGRPEDLPKSEFERFCKVTCAICTAGASKTALSRPTGTQEAQVTASTKTVYAVIHWISTT